MILLHKHDVFISYKSEEFSEANWVKSALEHNGITCWMAPGSIPGGSCYADEIADAIEGCSAFILIVSQKAQSSQHIVRELEIAASFGKTILPYMTENCQLQKAFKYYLLNLQWFNAYQDKEKSVLLF